MELTSSAEQVSVADLMLDMSGYKIEADDAEDKLAGACQGELVPGTQTEINGPIDEREPLNCPSVARRADNEY